MADKEKVSVKLGISGTYWDKKPQYCVYCNDTIILEGEITAPSGEIEYHKFDFEYDTDLVDLKIQFLNKTNEDTKKDNYEDPENYTIVGDLLLNIESLEIDEIELDTNLLFSTSKYTTDVEVDRDGIMTRDVRNCLNLGWNGVWSIQWSNPFYIWLLENI
jgi:hypothetical protein